MSQTSIQEIRTLKVGRYIVIDDEPCKLVEYTTSKPGKHGEAKHVWLLLAFSTAKKGRWYIP